MKTEATQAPAFRPIPGQWVDRCCIRQAGVKGRVKSRDLRHGWKPGCGCLDAGQRHRIVQRRELGQLSNCLPDAVVDQYRLLKAPAAMNHAMADGVHRRYLLQSGRNFALVPALFMPCP